MINLDHLSAAYRDQALWSDGERLNWIRADRWMRLPPADRALSRLEDLLSYPTRARMPCLLLYGQTGMGKTEIIRKFARDNPPSFNQGTGVTTTPVVVVQMPAEPIEEDFYNELLRALGVPGPVRSGARAARETARQLLGDMQTRVLVLDEINAMLAGTYRQQRLFLNTIRFLSNDLQIPIVCAGTEEARVALLTDPQLAERFDALQLEAWRDDVALQNLLSSFAAILPLRRASTLDTTAVRRRVIAMSAGVTGRIFRLIETVAIAAIISGRESLDESSFDDNDLVLPLASMKPAAKSRRTVASAAA